MNHGPSDTALRDPEVQLAIAYCPATTRPALTALWGLDARFGATLAITREDMVGRIKLAWWREALASIEGAAAPAEPLLRSLYETLPVRGITPAALMPIADGWEAVLDLTSADATALHASARGGTLFRLAAHLLGLPDSAPAATAGEGWALVDLAFHLRDRGQAEAALALARERLAQVAGHRWPLALRPLGVLAVLAARDAAAGLDIPRRQGSPARLLRALRLRITGR